MAVTTYAKSVNGKKQARVQSPDVAGGVLIPRIVYVDARDIKLSNNKTVAQGLQEIAPMYPKSISGDDYVLCLENSGIFT